MCTASVHLTRATASRPTHCLNPSSKIHTPHLDRLAAEGMAFEDAHATSAVCTPSRYGALTGRYNWRSSLKRGVLSGWSRHLIEPGRMTVASLLREHGYHTAMIGKWHLGWDWATTDGEPAHEGDVDFSRSVANGPNCSGFDYSYGHCGSLDMAPYVYMEDGRPFCVFLSGLRARRSDSSNDRLDARRLGILDRRGATHEVYVPPEPYRTLRSLAHYDHMLARTVTRTKNQLKALCRRYGIRYRGAGVYRKAGRREFLEKMPNVSVRGRKLRNGPGHITL